MFALGGVGADAIEEVLSAGASGVAMISAILSEADPESAASKIAGTLSRAREAEGLARKKG
jgi:thiamine-phosphate pyrophosphorylase